MPVFYASAQRRKPSNRRYRSQSSLNSRRISQPLPKPTTSRDFRKVQDMFVRYSSYEDTASETKHRMRHSSTVSGDAAFVFSFGDSLERGNFVQVNDAARKMLGYSPDERSVREMISTGVVCIVGTAFFTRDARSIPVGISRSSRSQVRRRPARVRCQDRAKLSTSANISAGCEINGFVSSLLVCARKV